MTTHATSTPALRIGVIGGGISGLAAAHRLIELSRASSKSVQVTLFEATGRLGGAFGTQQIGDYLIERGADSFITNKPWGVQLVRRLGLEERLITTNQQFRSSLILRRGIPVETPQGFNLVAAADLQAIMKTPLLSLTGKLRFLFEPFVRPKRTMTDESVASFVRRRIGQQALNQLVQPLVGGIYTSDPEVLSAHATLQRFVQMERDYGSLYRGLRAKHDQNAQKKEQDVTASGARYGLFASFPNGMQELLDALESEVRRHGLIRNHVVIKDLIRRNGHWQISTDAGIQEFDGLVLAVSAPHAARLLKSSSPATSQHLARIECASSAIVVSGHRLSDVKHPCHAFGLVIPHKENRKILATSFLSRKFENRAPQGRICFRTFIGGAMQPDEFLKTDDQIKETVLEELSGILGVSGTPDFVEVARYSQAMPQFTVGHLERIEELRKTAQELGSLSLAGNYFEGVGVPDSIHSGEVAAQNVLEKLLSKSSS